MYKASNTSFGLTWKRPQNPPVKVAPEMPIPHEIDVETVMACTLGATGNYKILRRLVARRARPSALATMLG
ncbi:hypothetical protein [Bradyrhizobium sp. WYCCWR 12699]|uniref:hypothetical protein n=1 Tax=Bradyrhizobium sp. WYCCWR 12699 TaxID=3064203 RepID=UPI0028A3C465|nr:hypothetical protein [Bradyrhizobium sp. WYCCWR 12699]MDT4740663.1 hypothetical protein [Bradyrhizobium sp. WYCCWR 12699]